MQSIFNTGATAAAIPIWFVTAANYKDVRERLSAGARAFADAAGFEPKPGQYLALPGEGGLSGILFGLESETMRRICSCPAGCRSNCRAASTASPTIRTMRGWRRSPSLSAPIVSRATTNPRHARSSSICRRASTARISSAWSRRSSWCAILSTRRRTTWDRPSSRTAARALAAKHGAGVKATVGDDLLKENFPLIHAVGRAAARPPRLIDLTWGDTATSARDAGRQGRLLRFRRPRHQARSLHAQYEEGHGRRGDRAGARAHDHVAQARKCGCAS